MKVTCAIGDPTTFDPDYESRCIKNDAERAAKMGDDPAKACSWEEGTPQHSAWMWAFKSAQVARQS